MTIIIIIKILARDELVVTISTGIVSYTVLSVINLCL
jgi:hypothetical protein